MSRILAAVLAAGAVVTLTAPARAQSDDDYGRSYSQDRSFKWSGSIATGGTIPVVDLNGGVDGDASDNGTTTVTAVKRWRHSDPATVGRVA